ncbi:hypothetical protein ACSTJP_00620, partial [Vibrio parahaemolyticus]
EKDMGGDLPSEVESNIRLLQKRAGKMRAQLNELLDYSKAGNYRAEPVLVNVNDLVRAIIDGLSNRDRVTFVVNDLPEFETLGTPLEHVLH